MARTKKCRLKLAIIGYILVHLFLLPSSSFATSHSLTQTKSQLQVLDNHISTLKKTLQTAHDQHKLLNDSLAKNEIQIGTSYESLQKMQVTLHFKEEKIRQIQQSIQYLNKKLADQQKLLYEHLRIRYQMGLHPPFIWIRDQAVSSIDHLTIFHHYLLQSRRKILDSIRTTQNQVSKNQQHLALEVAHQKILENQLRQNQEQLKQNKQHHRAIIASLDQEIQSKEQKLLDYERNKKNLSHLLQRIRRQNITSTTLKQPFKTMRHQLPHPIREAKIRIQKTGQGLTFFSREGSAVFAVYPGKIVFSDWLNGYGLLLIIDHGQGFMTLYAHNQALLKHKGQRVTEKDKIATSGFTGGMKPAGLYFEVRQSGKAVFPLEWLMKAGI